MRNAQINALPLCWDINNKKPIDINVIIGLKTKTIPLLDKKYPLGFSENCNFIL